MSRFDLAVDAERREDRRIGGLVCLQTEDAGEGIDVASVRPGSEALAYIPEQVARRYCVLPAGIEAGRLVVLAEHADVQMQNYLSLIARMPVRVQVAARGEIASAIDRCYGKTVEIPKETAEVRAGVQAGDESWAAKTVDTVLEGGIKSRASDIHLELQEQGRTAVVRYRVDGVMRDVAALPGDRFPFVVSRIKVLANLSLVERYSPQDGQIRVKHLDRVVDARVCVMPCVHGEKVVLRLLDTGRISYDLGLLGFEPDTLVKYRNMIAVPHGMVLVAGPTGSGKTTTLYASLGQLDRVSANVVTLEDPVEYLFPRVTQVQVNPKAGLTFAAGLRAIMRQDPDVVVVGEIRDLETAEIAVHAALTGHLVLSSIHAMNALSAVFRLLDMGVESYLVAAGLRGVVAQRLVRTVCEECVARTPLLDAERAYLEKWREIVEEPVWRGAGCERCGSTGYYGRTGVFEVLEVDEPLRQRISRSPDRGEIARTVAETADFIPLRAAALAKVRQGRTTVSEVMRALY